MLKIQTEMHMTEHCVHYMSFCLFAKEGIEANILKMDTRELYSLQKRKISNNLSAKA